MNTGTRLAMLEASDATACPECKKKFCCEEHGFVYRKWRDNYLAKMWQ